VTAVAGEPGVNDRTGLDRTGIDSRTAVGHGTGATAATEPLPSAEIDMLLAHVRDIEGLLAATLLEPLTGTVLAAVRDAAAGGDAGDPLPTVDPDLVAACAADVLLLVRELAARTEVNDAGGDVESVVVTVGGRFHLIRTVRGPAPEPLALVVTLDRAEANLAMAQRELREVGVRFGAR
jgi:hypothetical protein